MNNIYVAMLVFWLSTLPAVPCILLFDYVRHNAQAPLTKGKP